VSRVRFQFSHCTSNKILFAPITKKKRRRAPNGYDEEAAYDSYLNPRSGFRSGPGDAVSSSKMTPCFLVSQSSLPSGLGGRD
jgi:hypothetical protein